MTFRYLWNLKVPLWTLGDFSLFAIMYSYNLYLCTYVICISVFLQFVFLHFWNFYFCSCISVIHSSVVLSFAFLYFCNLYFGISVVYISVFLLFLFLQFLNLNFCKLVYFFKFYFLTHAMNIDSYYWKELIV